MIALVATAALAFNPHAPALGRPAVRRAPAPRLADDLAAEFARRVAADSEKKTLPVLGVEDLGADVMGPIEVVDYVMKGLAGGPEVGLAAVLQFSLKVDGPPEDELGQVRPGTFGDPAAFGEYLGSAGNGRYTIMNRLSEFKCMGVPDTSDMGRQAVQKLLIRSDEGNWKDLFLNMRLMKEFEPAPRWVITSIYMSGQ